MYMHIFIQRFCMLFLRLRLLVSRQPMSLLLPLSSEGHTRFSPKFLFKVGNKTSPAHSSSQISTTTTSFRTAPTTSFRIHPPRHFEPQREISSKYIITRSLVATYDDVKGTRHFESTHNVILDTHPHTSFRVATRNLASQISNNTTSFRTAPTTSFRIPQKGEKSRTASSPTATTSFRVAMSETFPTKVGSHGSAYSPSARCRGRNLVSHLDTTKFLIPAPNMSFPCIRESIVICLYRSIPAGVLHKIKSVVEMTRKVRVIPASSTLQRHLSLCITAFLLICILSPLSSNAQSLNPTDIFQNQNNTTLVGSLGLSNNNLVLTVARIIRSFVSLLGILFVVIVLIGGFEWLTSSGEGAQVDKAKVRVIQGITGMIVVLVSFSIAQFIINSIVSATT